MSSKGLKTAVSDVREKPRRSTPSIRPGQCSTGCVSDPMVLVWKAQHLYDWSHVSGKRGGRRSLLQMERAAPDLNLGLGTNMTGRGENTAQYLPYSF